MSQEAGAAGRSAATLEAAVAEAVTACNDAVADLDARGIAREALADYVPPRRIMLINRPATMTPIAEVWRLGSLLLGTDARLYALGHTTRAAERGRPGYQSVSREERREIAAAALRGGYAAGTPVNFHAPLLPLTVEGVTGLGPEAPLGFANDTVCVRWRAGAPLDGAPSLRTFLRERTDLLTNRP